MRSSYLFQFFVLICVIFEHPLMTYCHSNEEHASDYEDHTLQHEDLDKQRIMDKTLRKFKPEPVNSVNNDIIIISTDCLREKLVIEETVNSQFWENRGKDRPELIVLCPVDSPQGLRTLKMTIEEYNFKEFQLNFENPACNFEIPVAECRFTFTMKGDSILSSHLRILSDHTRNMDEAPVEPNVDSSGTTSSASGNSTNNSSNNTSGGRLDSSYGNNTNTTSESTSIGNNATSTASPGSNSNTTTNSTKEETNQTSSAPEKENPSNNNPSSISKDDTNQTTSTEESGSDSSSIDFDTSTSTTLIITGIGFLVLVSVALICYWKKKKSKSRKPNKGDRQKLVRKVNSPTPIKVPDLASPNIKNLKFPGPTLLSSEPNTGMSPLHQFRPAPNLRLEENGRSSLVPDEIILTNIDNSPKSVTEVSSLASVRDAPKTLDFNIEFSMVEQESIMKIKKGTEGKKKIDF